MLFNLDFSNNAILMCFFFFLLIIDLYFLIPAVIAQIFNPIAKLVTPLEIPIKEAKSEIEIHQVIEEAKIRKCSLLYFFKEIISCFIYIFCSKFLAYVFFIQIFKVIIYFQLNQEFLSCQFFLLLKIFFIFIFALIANNRKNMFFVFSILTTNNAINFFHLNLFHYWKI